jgi:hypothetical protein
MIAQTKGVDVLKTLRRIAEGDGDTEVMAMRVHAAIAELIEANRALLDSSPAHMTHRNAKEREAYRAIRAALARVGGAP